MLTKEVSSQIQFLHSQCKENHEWSGLLVYKVSEGTIEDFVNPDKPEAKLELSTVGIFPMDFGDATFTSFEAGEDWIKCFEQFPQIDPVSAEPGYYLGKIHSHHSMDAFHSGTDNADLMENAEKLPMFLSLIVNYACRPDCKLAFPMEAEETVLTRNVWKLKNWLASEKVIKKSVTTYKPIFTVDCDVLFEEDSWFVKQTKAVSTKKKTPTTVGFDINTLSPTGKDIPLTVWNTVQEELADLITLGEGSYHMTNVAALNVVNNYLNATDGEKYAKAIQYYFIDNWFDSSFVRFNVKPVDAINAILTYLEKEKYSLVKYQLTNGLNNLKKNYSYYSAALWEV